MSKEEITKEILSILGNFKLSENIQLKELTSLYMKQQEEIERLHSIIKEVREYIERNTEEKKSWLNGIPDYRVFKGDTKELLEILDKEKDNE